MVQIKIQCGCGQRYAFEVEPVHGFMPGNVACPVCGADGTPAANDAIAKTLGAQPLPAVAADAPVPVAAPVRVAAPASGLRARMANPPPAEAPVQASAPAPSAAPRRPGRLPGQVDPDTARTEARAKIFWGDAPEEVTKYLMMQGFKVDEASAIVREFFQERVKALRAKGTGKILMGSGLVCIPIGAFFAFMSMGFFPIKIFAVTIMAGLYGLYLVLKGIIMLAAPKSEPGEV